MAELLQLKQDRRERTLVTDVHAVGTIVEFEFVTHFVYGVVGEMHEEVAQVLLFWRTVG